METLFFAVMGSSLVLTALLLIETILESNNRRKYENETKIDTVEKK